MNKKNLSISAILFGSLVLSAPAHALSYVSNLFNTGVDNSGNPLGDSVADPHYTLTNFPSGTVPPAVTVPYGNATFGYGWVPNTTTSRWIGPNSVDANGPVGNYTYKTTFSLPSSFSTASITGQWVTDNNGVDIFINGVSQGFTTGYADYNVYHQFSISNNLVAGTNSLEFEVYNGGGPTGLQINNLVGTYTNVPFEFSPEQGFILGIPLFLGLRKLKKIKSK